MATQVQFRRGTTTQHNSFTGATGEISVNTTTETLHVHDGSTTGGFPLARADGNNVVDWDVTNVDVSGVYQMDGTTIINTSRQFVGAGLQVDTTGSNAIDFQIVDSDANVSFNGSRIDYTSTGSQDLTGDRTKAALLINANSDVAGGDTANEHRLHGIRAITRATGDSDLIYGIYNTAEAEQTTGTVSALYGAYLSAVADAAAGQITNSYGSYNIVTLSASSGTTITNVYGSWNMANFGSTQESDVNKMVGVYGEAQISTSTGQTITNAMCFEAQFDNNSAGATTIDNGYLYYGNYAGTLPTNAYGLYIVDAVNSYTAGGFLFGTTDTTPWNNTGTAEGAYISAEGRIGSAVVDAPPLDVNRLNTAGSIIRARFNGTEVGSISSFDQSGVERVSFINTDDNGLGIRRGSSTIFQVVPIVNDATIATPLADLGHEDAPWRDIYLHDGVVFQDSGSSGTASTNRLDAYEEGTWTPTYTTSNSDGTFTYDVIQKGYYTLIGNVVHASFRLRTDAVSGVTGNLLISGLPFPAKNVTSAGQGGSLVVGRAQNFGTNFPVKGYVSDNAATINVLALTSLNANSTASATDMLIDGANKNDMMAHIVYVKA
jgi:hypothetical protein